MALEGNDKRALIILGVVAGIAILVGGFLLLTGGSEPVTVDAAAAPVDASTDPGAAPAPTTDSPSPVVPPTTSSFDGPLIGGRDPFSPFPIAVSATPTTSSSTSASPSTTSELQDEATIDGNTVKLEAIIERKIPEVEVSVNGASSRAAAGEEFSRYYSVVAIDTGAKCSDLRYTKGDFSESFTLCIQ